MFLLFLSPPENLVHDLQSVISSECYLNSLLSTLGKVAAGNWLSWMRRSQCDRGAAAINQARCTFRSEKNYRATLGRGERERERGAEHYWQFPTLQMRVFHFLLSKTYARLSI